MQTCLRCSCEFEGRARRNLCSRCYQEYLRNPEPERYPRSRAEIERKEKECVDEYLKLHHRYPRATMKDLCQEVGVTPNTMCAWLRRRGYEGQRMPGRNPYRGNPEALAEDYWMMIADGFNGTMTDAAARFGVSDQTLYRALKKVNYEW